MGTNAARVNLNYKTTGYVKPIITVGIAPWETYKAVKVQDTVP